MYLQERPPLLTRAYRNARTLARMPPVSLAPLVNSACNRYLQLTLPTTAVPQAARVAVCAPK